MLLNWLRRPPKTLLRTSRISWPFLIIVQMRMRISYVDGRLLQLLICCFSIFEIFQKVQNMMRLLRKKLCESSQFSFRGKSEVLPTEPVKLAPAIAVWEADSRSGSRLALSALLSRMHPDPIDNEAPNDTSPIDGLATLLFKTCSATEGLKIRKEKEWHNLTEKIHVTFFWS